MFADKLISGTRLKGPLCVGIDPHVGKVPGLFGPDGPDAITKWGEALLEIAAKHVSVVKPQAAFFERWGPEGMAALQSVCRTAQSLGLLVILDAKRGDIGSTAQGYAAAYLGPEAVIPSDALTINPYMGVDTVEAFATVARDNSRGVAVLARTSNPGSADFQAKLIDGQPLYKHVAESLQSLAESMIGPETGWSSLMLVAGATGPEEARKLRLAAPKCPFLVPGYGAQGASPDEAMAGFVKGFNGLEGGVVSASRSVTFPEAAQSARTIAEWAIAIESAMIAAQNELKTAQLP